jgi:alkanesulfonate monooxygenase SsuD/methylene tetrahydromethanopterin reductase-like flavin-dependent oxidoreductase (luciferase family)
VGFSISIPQRGVGSFDGEGVKSYLQKAEQLGFEGGWVMEQVVVEAPMLAPLEVLAYAAACTNRLRLGVAVLITSLHDPLQLASSITAVDRLSHGRLDVGVGHGGNFRPFAAFGVEKAAFISYFTEGLELMKAAWSDAPRVTFHGRFRQVENLPIQPKPVQRPHPPIIIGGSGAKKTPRLAATFADEYNVPFEPLDTITTQIDRVREAVDAVGRPADSMTYSAAFVVCAGRDEAEIAKRAAAIGRDVDELRSNSPLAGTPDQIVDQLGPYAEIGLQRVYLQLLDLSDLEHLGLFADEVQRQL